MEIPDECCFSPIKNDDQISGGFSLTSPDLVCIGSPVITEQESFDCLSGKRDGISQTEARSEMEETSCNASASDLKDFCTEASFELFATPLVVEKCTNDLNADIEHKVGYVEECVGIQKESMFFSSEKCVGGVEAVSDAEVVFSSEPEPGMLKDNQTWFSDGDLDKIRIENELQKRELLDTKKALEELRNEYKAKNQECQEALKSLNELKNELMRKSMHVGSLAFAIEGQVKEKSRWFSSLKELTRRLQFLKMDHFSLLEEASKLKHCVAEMDGVKSAIQSTFHQHLQSEKDIGMKFLHAEKERKELYNKVVELRGNIRVFCRCRPLNAEETESGASMAVDFESKKNGEITLISNGITKKAFKFDAVFPPEADQSNVFEETAPLANSVLDGYNVCIFAYGQTGTGKTFTMEGTPNARGVNYRTLEKLFHIIEERKHTFHYEVSVSVLEVYNEQIRDLLASESNPGSVTKRLEIKQVGEMGHHVPGLVEAQVSNVSEVWQVLQRGCNGRAVGLTSMNEHSSRSHCIHCVMVKADNLINGESTRSKLWLVDLAGSERLAKSEVQGDRLKETQNINRSLSALGDVISALATKSPHIPFRNSKLTHLLQDSLGGDSKALMFVQISPNENDLNETLCSLNFASRVRGIELGPAKKQLMDKTELFKNKHTVEKLRQDLKSKESQVKKLEDINYCLEVKVKDREMKNRSFQEKIKELESQLAVERKLARQHVDSRIAEQMQQLKRQEDEENHLTVRAPLADRTPSSEWKGSEVEKTTTLSAENADFSFYPPCLIEKLKISDSMDKENNPQIAQELNLASGKPLIPQLYSHGASKLAPFHSDEAEDYRVETTCLPQQITCSSPKDKRNRSKKMMSSGLRKSLQNRIHTKFPLLQPPLRRVGVNVGTERLRVSIGRRPNGQRMFLGGGARKAVTAKETQQKQSQREKERGWNMGGTSALRTIL